MTAPRTLALTALLLGAAALSAGDPGRPGDPGVQELRAELATGEPFIDAVTLGEWIRDREPVRILDIRDPAAADRLSIPTARPVSRRELSGIERSGPPIVVYDDGGGGAAPAWLVLRRLGHPRVLILDRGVSGWIDGVIQPVMPAGTAAEKAAYDRAAAVSRYFGGIPRVGERVAPSGDAMSAVRSLGRRGCY